MFPMVQIGKVMVREIIEDGNRSKIYYLLTSWSRVLLEKITSSAASQEIPCILWNPKFITVLTSAPHLSLS